MDRVLEFARSCAGNEQLGAEDEVAVAEGKAQIARGDYRWGEDIERELGL